MSGSRVLGLTSRARVSGLGSNPQDWAQVSGLGYHQESLFSGPTFRVCPKKWCFEKYCSCDKACQFSASEGIHPDSALKKTDN